MEVSADALVQAYDSEVVAPSEGFTPASSQRDNVECVTEPHGFSRSADGGGVLSCGDWLAPRAGINDIFQDSRHATVEHCQTRASHCSQGGMGGTKPLTLYAGQAQR